MYMYDELHVYDFVFIPKYFCQVFFQNKSVKIRVERADPKSTEFYKPEKDENIKIQNVNLIP